MLCIDLTHIILYISGRINTSSKKNNYVSIETKHFKKNNVHCALQTCNQNTIARECSHPQYTCMTCQHNYTCMTCQHNYPLFWKDTSFLRDTILSPFVVNQNLQLGGTHYNSRITPVHHSSSSNTLQQLARRRDFPTKRQMPIAASSN